MATKRLRFTRGKVSIRNIPPGSAKPAVAAGTPHVISNPTPGDWESFIKQKLEEAESLRPKIESSTVQLNEVIANAEKALAGLKLGVVARTELWDTDDGSTTYLQFQKHQNDWRLCIIIENEDDPDPSHVQFSLLSNATRETRLAAVEALGFLLDEMVAQVIIDMKDIDEKVNNGSQFVAALNTFTKSKGAEQLVTRVGNMEVRHPPPMTEEQRQKFAANLKQSAEKHFPSGGAK